MIVCCDFPEIGLPVTLLAYLAHWVVWGSAWSWGSILIFDFVVSSFLLVVRYWYCLGLMIRLTIYGKSCGISLIATWLKYLGQIRVIARILYFAGWTKIYPCIEEILWTWILGQFRKGIKKCFTDAPSVYMQYCKELALKTVYRNEKHFVKEPYQIRISLMIHTV